MMRHPFLHGIVSASPTVPSVSTSGTPAPLSRRTFFGFVSAAAGLSTFILGRSSSAQALGPRTYTEGDGRFSAQAGGELGGEYRSDGRVTTQAVDEEGGGGYRSDGRVTTQAVGEEGGWSGGSVTTQAVGEEGGYYRGWRYRRYPGRYYAPRYRQYYPRRYTTFAVGEEGGGYYSR